MGFCNNFPRSQKFIKIIDGKNISTCCRPHNFQLKKKKKKQLETIKPFQLRIKEHYETTEEVRGARKLLKFYL